MEKLHMHRRALAILLLCGAARVMGAGESAPDVVGQYRAPVPSEIRATLVLEVGGSARYAVTRLNGDGTEVLLSYSGTGRWALYGTTLTLTLPVDAGQGTIVYEVSTCTRHDIRIRPCSMGLLPVKSDMPKWHTWALVKSDESKAKRAA